MPPYNSAQKPVNFRNHQNQKIITFVIIFFVISLIFKVLMLVFNPNPVGKEYYILGIVWSPGIAALITSCLYGKDLAELGWNWGNSRYQLWSYVTPLLYTSTAYLVTWLSGLGYFFNTDSVREIAKNFGWEALPTGLVITLYVLFMATYGLLENCVNALGEEIGWRGFLVPELIKITTFSKTALISGIIWAVWHYPEIFFGDYNSGTSVWYSAFCFTLAVIAISFPMAWLRLKSGSLWTGMVFHASDNLFIQDIFNPLTQNTGITRYIIGEFGIAVAITSVIAGYIYWQLRHQLPNIKSKIKN